MTNEELWAWAESGEDRKLTVPKIIKGDHPDLIEIGTSNSHKDIPAMVATDREGNIWARGSMGWTVWIPIEAQHSESKP